MTAESCREWRGDLAAEAGGRIDGDARTRLLAHLDGCAPCRAELRELKGSAALLALADPAHVRGEDDDDPLPPALGAAILSRLQTEQSRARRTRRRRRGMFGGALVAAAAAIALAVALWSGSNGGAPHDTVALRTNGARANAVLVRDKGGTEVRIKGAGLHRSERYWLWLTGPDGVRVGAGTFNGGTNGTFDIETYCALPYSQVRRVWITNYRNGVVLDSGVTVRT